MMLRENSIGWGWEVYIEMFVVGTAAGAFLIGMLLQFFGRGGSPFARTAHFLALPLALVGTALLILKLERSERFWHMAIQSENFPLPMFQWWTPISFGVWILIGFSIVATVSFADAIISRGWLRLGPWRKDNTIHGNINGGIIGKVVAVAGIIMALLLAYYSGALISVTAVPGWQDTIFISSLFIGISVATGAGALLLVEAIRRTAPLDEIDSVSQFGSIAIVWQVLVIIVLGISLGGAVSFFFSSIRTITAAIAGVIFMLTALPLLYLRVFPSDPLRLGAASVLMLASGFLIRYTMVMGPQHEIE